MHRRGYLSQKGAFYKSPQATKGPLVQRGLSQFTVTEGLFRCHFAGSTNLEVVLGQSLRHG